MHVETNAETLAGKLFYLYFIYRCVPIKDTYQIPTFKHLKLTRPLFYILVSRVLQ